MSSRPLALLALAVAFTVAACGPRPAPVKPTPTRPQTSRPASRPPLVQRGLASWYGGKHHGGPTASGERFNKNAMTAAHRKLKMNTRVRVTNQRNGRSVVVRINDRGPYGRAIIDLSEAAARKLDMIKAGVVPVRIEVLR
ncbi:MAG: septal ring lytic transglycosylase RlpA family protein [Kofleriaceae bacterium]